MTLSYEIPLPKADYSSELNQGVEVWFQKPSNDLCFYAEALTEVLALSAGTVVAIHEPVNGEERLCSQKDIVLALDNGLCVGYAHVVPIVQEGQRVINRESIGTFAPGKTHIHVSTRGTRNLESKIVVKEPIT